DRFHPANPANPAIRSLDKPRIGVDGFLSEPTSPVRSPAPSGVPPVPGESWPVTAPSLHDAEVLEMLSCPLYRRSHIAHLDRPMPWLWDGYVSRFQLTLLTGQWKIGKTTLLAALLARMGAGGELAGRRVSPGRAVVITEEGA